MDGKRGISLVLLVVTVLVIGILSTIVIANTNGSIKESKQRMYTAELQNIEDMCVTAKELGTLEEYISADRVNMDTLKKLANSSVLEQDFLLNKESANAKFAAVDVERITDGKVTKGRAQKGEKDTFYLSLDTYKVYYLQGYKVDGGVYYSHNKRFAGQNGETVLEENAYVSAEVTEGDNFFFATSANKKVTIHLKEPITNGAKLCMEVVTKDGSKYVEDVTRNAANREYQIAEGNVVTKNVLQNAKEISFTVQEGSKKKTQKLEDTYLADIDVACADILLSRVVPKENSKMLFLECSEEVTYFILEQEYIDEEGNLVEAIHTSNLSQKFLQQEIEERGKKVEGNIASISKYITKVLIVAKDLAGNYSNIVENKI